MTTQEKLIRKKLSLLELAGFLTNVSQACRINGCSRQHFYDVKQAYAEHGAEEERDRRLGGRREIDLDVYWVRASSVWGQIH